MSNKLYVGNLPFKLDEDRLGDIFAEFGEVRSVKIITDRETGRARGFGFVEMSNPDEAQDAIAGLDGKEVEGRNMRVNIAEDRNRGDRRPPRAGGFR